MSTCPIYVVCAAQKLIDQSKDIVSIVNVRVARVCSYFRAYILFNYGD